MPRTAVLIVAGLIVNAVFHGPVQPTLAAVIDGPAPAAAAVRMNEAPAARELRELPSSERLSIVREERVALADLGQDASVEAAPEGSCTDRTGVGTESPLEQPVVSVGAVLTACPVCRIGIPCGNTCISARYTCRTFGGCASYGGPIVPVAPAVPEYARTPEFSPSTQSDYPTLALGATAELSLRVVVRGGPSWSDQDVSMIVSNTEQAGTGLRGWDGGGLIAYNKGTFIHSPLQDFRLRIQALSPGKHRLRVHFVHKTFGTVGPDGVYWDVTVLASSGVGRLLEGWHSRWAGQSEYPTMYPGEIRTFFVRFTNVGTEPWTRGVWGRQVNLALNGDDKGPARLGMGVNWLWDDRIATTALPTTAPGETAAFSFQVRAPRQPGSYTLNLRPVVDGTVWLEDEGVFWTITVR